MSRLQEYIQKYADIYTGEQSVITGDKRLNVKTGASFFPGYQGTKHLPKHIQKVIQLKNRAVSVLDYGCGLGEHMYRRTSLLENKTTFEYFKGMLQSYYLYDPCYAPYNTKPTPGSQFDITICTDVMEHIPEESVDEVLQDIAGYTKPDGVVMFTISGIMAIKKFESGENLHITVKDLNWWVNKLESNITQTFIVGHKQGDGSTVVKLRNTSNFVIQ